MTTDTHNKSDGNPPSNHKPGLCAETGEKHKAVWLKDVDTPTASLEQDGNQEKGNLIWRKRLNTTFIGLAFTCFGLTFSIFGPALLDLLHIVNVNIEEGAIFFTSASIGYLAGCVICGIAIEKFNQDVLMFVFTFTMGAFFIAIPWAKVKAVMAVLDSLYAFSAGAIDAGVNTVCMQIWGIQVGPYMQAIYFLYSIGGLLGPFIAEPFLMAKTNTTMSSFDGNHSEFSNTSNNNTRHIQLDDTDQQQETRVYIAFLIGGIMTIAVSIPFIYLFFKNKAHDNWNTEPQQEQEEGGKLRLALSGKIVYLALLAIFFIVYMNIEDSFVIFLAAFVVEYAGLSKSDGANIMSVYWGTFAVSRLLSVLIAKVLSPWKMIMLDLIIVLITLLVLCFLAHIPAFLWASSAFVALGMASLFGASFAWIEIKIMKVDGHVASFLLLSGGVGGIINQFVIGHLFENYTPMWFVWLLTGECMLLILIFSGITVLTKAQFGQMSFVKNVDLDVYESLPWIRSTDV